MKITWIGSPYFGYPQGIHGRNDQKIIAIVLHVAQGPMSAVDAWFQSPENLALNGGSSAHYGVGKDGTIHAYVKEEDAAWGCGKVDNPTWSLLTPNLNPNLYCINIEHEGFSGEVWSMAMLDADIWLIGDICRRWNIPIDEDHIIPHAAIDSIDRINCPGSGVPWYTLMYELKYGKKETSTMIDNSMRNTMFKTGYIFHGGTNGGMPLGRQEHYGKWVKAIKDMGGSGVKLIIFDDATNIDSQAILAVRYCLDNGLTVVARLFREHPYPGILTENHIKVAKLLASLGCRWIETSNEPNLSVEWVGDIPSNAPEVIANNWLIDAKRVIDVGGYPAIPACAPGGNWDDGDMMNKVFAALKPKMTKTLLDNTWIAVHNYSGNHPLDYPYDAINVAEKGTVDIMKPGESNGFLKPIMLGTLSMKYFGRYLPIIGTEGGPVIDPGFSNDPRYPKVLDEAIHAAVATEMARWMMDSKMVPDYFWANCYWVLGNRTMENASNAGFEEHSFFPYWAMENGRLAVRAMIEMPKHPRTSTEPPKPVNLETIRNDAWNKPKGGEVIAYNADLAFPKYAREHNLGIPLTNEWPVGQYTVQAFAMGIVYCVTGKWSEVTHMAW